MRRTIVGRLKTGGGAGRGWVERNDKELQALLGVELYPGTLYVVLKYPFLLSDQAKGVADSTGIVPVKVNGKSAYLKKSKIRKPYTSQLLSDVHLRSALDLADGDEVKIEIDDVHIRRLTWAEYAEVWRTGRFAKSAKRSWKEARRSARSFRSAVFFYPLRRAIRKLRLK